MIFLGDIAHPFPEPPAWLRMQWPWATHQAVVANLEGGLVSKSGQADVAQRRLFNHASVVHALVSANVQGVSLANNHIMDVPEGFAETFMILRANGISFTCAGGTLAEASLPMKLVEEDKTWRILAVGWNAIQCKLAKVRRAGVNPLRPESMLSSIRACKLRYPDSILMVMPHWNYEMELYPQPAHRQLAMEAIDAGADGVIGHHPHRVGGIEIYRGRPIAYSLGNWWMPQGVYFDGKLKLGNESLLQLALEWLPHKEIVCHWFEYRREGHYVNYVGSEALSKSARIQQLTPFAGMEHKTYQKWFAAHRVKRKALPIYNDYRHCLLNSIKDFYVRTRHSTLRLLESSGLRRFLKV